ncbi:mycofactocin precursor MftA [Nocardioides bizhenqiangii]|uniref:Mycofactocin MftA n=1 Tax=Nocardioides bizhenqiangii TaxID=3095076 RepID=A0ABZ0ZMB0_9ACTN|nr:MULTISPECIES: mycofactocin precursor MftA [unclassified Nocardioides]MDZ5621044.1 mycofactocin precursor MftA [Nocardioides sp. HM23]WQQ25400.1 mycofactocin precursor MftA [Nocardioides sp. HM61]
MSQTHITSPEVHPSNDEPILAEDLIEEVSIDGMCGVY